MEIISMQHFCTFYDLHICQFRLKTNDVLDQVKKLQKMIPGKLGLQYNHAVK